MHGRIGQLSGSARQHSCVVVCLAGQCGWVAMCVCDNVIVYVCVCGRAGQLCSCVYEAVQSRVVMQMCVCVCHTAGLCVCLPTCIWQRSAMRLYSCVYVAGQGSCVAVYVRLCVAIGGSEAGLWFRVLWMCMCVGGEL